MTFEDARAQFPVLEQWAYLNAGTFGPLPRKAVTRMQETLAAELRQGRGGKIYFDGIFDLRTRVRAQMASLLHADPTQIALTSSTTDGCNIVLAGLDLQPHDEIVTTDAEHFGLAGPIFASGAGVRVAQVRGRPAADALDALVAAVTPRTKLIATSHVLWTTGQVLDVHALKSRSDRLLLVDGAQSVGAIPIDVGEIDFYTVSGQKWLCGPAATGALFIRDPESLRVARPSYFAQESFVPGGEFVPRAGSQRFDSGWISAGALAGLAEALDLAPEWRFERVREIAAHCRAALMSSGVEVVTEPHQAGLITFVSRDDPAAAAERALDRGVVIRNLPDTEWLRASCGWWNNERDVERLLDVL